MKIGKKKNIDDRVIYLNDIPIHLQDIESSPFLRGISILIRNPEISKEDYKSSKEYLDRKSRESKEQKKLRRKYFR